MASKYGIFSSSRVVRLLFYIGKAYNTFWNYVHSHMGTSKCGGAYTKDNSK